MASRIAARYIPRRFSSGGKVLSEEEKAAENVYIKKVEKEKLEKLAHKVAKPEEPVAAAASGATDAKASATSSSAGASTEKVSTDKHRNYGVLAGTITALGALGWYLKSGSEKPKEVGRNLCQLWVEGKDFQHRRLSDVKLVILVLVLRRSLVLRIMLTMLAAYFAGKHKGRLLCSSEALQGPSYNSQVPLVASNRIGTEIIEIAHGNSKITFYRNSSISGPTGELVASANDKEKAVIVAKFDLDKIKAKRHSWEYLRLLSIRDLSLISLLASGKKPTFYKNLVRLDPKDIKLRSGDPSSGAGPWTNSLFKMLLFDETSIM
ncbi:hypothetical protein ACFE04_028757 [Oxalis oulophora]